MRSKSVSPEISAVCSSPAIRLPQEIVEIIIAYLSYDTCSLRACTLTCYSWYIAAVPRLHRVLIASTNSLVKNRKPVCPKPLLHKYKLGLLPLVETFWLRGNGTSHIAFSPKLFDCYHLRQLTSVRWLQIDYLDVPSFMPRIRRYFKHFLPTVRSLALTEPKGSRRQIIYFIGLFKHLESLQLLYDRAEIQEEPGDDLTLTPLFVPPLRGSLRMARFTRTGLLKDMIDLFGGIRFHHMDLFIVDGMRLLLDACAKTLKTLRLHPTDPHGEQLSLKCTQLLVDDVAARYSPRDFDLSQNKSLRTLEVSASSINRTTSGSTSSDTASFLKHMLSTITSSTLPKIIVIYWDHDFRGVESWCPDRPHLRRLPLAERAKEASQYHTVFEVLREVHKVRDFRLALRAEVSGCAGEYPVQILEEAVAEEKAKKGFDKFFPEPPVMYIPRKYYPTL
jgi:hypothetical protein